MAVTVKSLIRGKPIYFYVDRPNDLIQKEHVAGRFYEQEELDIFESHYKGGSYIDVGSNVGNHIIFAAKFLGIKKIYSFEANPAALPALYENIILNKLSAIVIREYLGKVVSSSSEGQYEMNWQEGNLGAARPVRKAGGICSVVGDVALSGVDVGYIKIDVEGNEIDVLNGLRKTIERCKPRMFIEVDDSNNKTFMELIFSMGYVIDYEYRRYQVNTNYFISPK